jgi:hypothetical protein
VRKRDRAFITFGRDHLPVEQFMDTGYAAQIHCYDEEQARNIANALFGFSGWASIYWGSAADEYIRRNGHPTLITSVRVTGWTPDAP